MLGQVCICEVRLDSLPNMPKVQLHRLIETRGKAGSRRRGPVVSCARPFAGPPADSLPIWPAIRPEVVIASTGEEHPAGAMREAIGV